MKSQWFTLLLCSSDNTAFTAQHKKRLKQAKISSLHGRMQRNSLHGDFRETRVKLSLGGGERGKELGRVTVVQDTAQASDCVWSCVASCRLASPPWCVLVGSWGQSKTIGVSVPYPVSEELGTIIRTLNCA